MQWLGARLGLLTATALAVVAVGSWAGEAEAQPRRILVLPLTSDFLPERLARQIEEQLRDEIASSLPRYQVLPRPALDLQSLKLAAGCGSDSPKCFALIGRTVQATFVVYVSLLGSEKQAVLQVRRVSSRRAKESKYEAELADVGAGSSKELRWHVATALGARPPPLMGRIVLMSASKMGSLDGARILLDDQTVPLSALEQVNPGRHRIEVRKTGFRTFVRMVSVKPGRDTPVRVSFVPREAPPPSPPVASNPPPIIPPTASVRVEESSGPVWTWILGAGAVVAAGTATVFGVQVLGLESDAESAELNCESEHRSDDICSDGRSRALMANVTWGVAGALAVGAVIAYFVESGGESEDSSTRVGLSPTPGGVSAAFEVEF